MRENKIKRKLFSAHFISSGLPSVARSPLDTTLLAAASAADVVVERPRGGALPPVQTFPPQGVIARAPTWFPPIYRLPHAAVPMLEIFASLIQRRARQGQPSEAANPGHRHYWRPHRGPGQPCHRSLHCRPAPPRGRPLRPDGISNSPPGSGAAAAAPISFVP